MRVNFCPKGFFKVGSLAEKSGIYCRWITILVHIFGNTVVYETEIKTIVSV